MALYVEMLFSSPGKCHWGHCCAPMYPQAQQWQPTQTAWSWEHGGTCIMRRRRTVSKGYEMSPARIVTAWANSPLGDEGRPASRP